MRIVSRSKNRRQKFPRLGKTTPNRENTRSSTSKSNSDENPTVRLQDIEFQILPTAHLDESKPKSNPASISRIDQNNKPEPITNTEMGLLSQDFKNSKLKSKNKLKKSRSSDKEIKIMEKIKKPVEPQNIEEDSDLSVTFQDLKFNLWGVKFYSVLKMALVDLDVESGLLQVNKNKSRGWKYLDKFLFASWQFYAIGRILNLIYVAAPYVFHFHEFSSPLHLVRNFTTTFVTAGCIGLYFGYIQIMAFDVPSINSTANALLQNLRNKQNGNGNTNANAKLINKSEWNWKVGMRKRFKSIFHRSFRVNLFIYLPLFMYSLIFFLPGLLVLDPDSPIFWTSFCFGSNFTGIRRFFCPLLFIMDVIFYLFMVSHVYMATFIMLSFFILTEEAIEDAIQIVRSRNGLDKAKGHLQIIKLQVILFNRVFSTVVYLTKLIALAGAIIGGFLAIKFFPSEPLLVFGSVVISLDGTICYFVLFDKVNLITDQVEGLKQEIKVKAQHPKQNLKVRDECTRIYRSVQSLGIQAGGFYTMERENTLIFIDYVVGQVVSLLLAFP